MTDLSKFEITLGPPSVAVADATELPAARRREPGWKPPYLNAEVGECHRQATSYVTGYHPFDIAWIDPCRKDWGYDKWKGLWIKENLRLGYATQIFHGDPNHDGIPKWAPFTESNRAMMIWDTTSEVKIDPDQAARQALVKA